MPNELERRIQERLPGLPMTRGVRRSFENVMADTGLAVFRDDAAAFVATHNMQNVSNLIDEARAICGDDPMKMAACSQIIKEYVGRARRTQSLLGW